MNEFNEHDIAMMSNWSELREAKDISLQKISQLTNIPEKKLHALEAHNFSLLGPETFALGYLRSYAKMVNEDPTIFVQVYRDALSSNTSVPEKHTQTLSAIRWLPPLIKNVNILHLSIAVIVIWIVSMMLFGGDSDSEVTSPVTERSAAPLVREKYEDSIIGSAEVSSEGGASKPVTAESESGLSATISDDIAGESALDGDEGADALQSESLPETFGSDEDLLVLAFSDDCWVEVRDASGSVLIAELQRKGDNQRVFGQAPFEVMLGNSRVVTLALNGEAVAFQPNSGKKTLRFTVRP